MTEIKTPTQEQQQIIKSNTNTIVVSNPGTGKTYTLSQKVIHLLENGVKPDDILCITFTKKAKKEMYEAIHDSAKNKFREQIKKVHIHTFHSFVYNYLIDRGLDASLNVDDNLLRFSIFDSLTKKNATHYGKDYIITEIVPNTANAIKYIKSFGIVPKDIDIARTSKILEQNYNNSSSSSTYTLEELKAFLGYFTQAYAEYENSKQNTMDYTDILLRFLEKFDGHKYEHVLIDEMQDMNSIQAEIAEKIAENIFLVGDQKQAIFGFQGGSTVNLNKFKVRCQEMSLSANRRSTQQILEYAKQYYLNSIESDTAKDLEKFCSEKKGDIPVVISTDVPLVNILKLVKENTEKNIGIIARTNKQVAEISEFLDNNKIRNSSTATGSSTTNAKNEIINFLSGLLYNEMEKKIRGALAIFSPFTLKKAFEFSNEFKKNPNHNKLQELKSWGCNMTAKDLDDVFNHTILPICVSQGAEWFSTAVSIKQNIKQYLEFKTPTLDELFDYLAICEESDTVQIMPQKNKDTINDNKNVTVSTIHKAKGQEFDAVIYLPKDVKHTSFIDRVKTAILESRSIDTSEELSEEQMRLHFVALTRAKNKLAVIVDGKSLADFNMENLAKVIMQNDTNEESDIEATTSIASNAGAQYITLSEAYALFVNDRIKDSQNILKQRKENSKWIKDKITAYFKEMEHVSYSKITTSPSEFMQKNIIGTITATYASNKSMTFGTMFHNAMLYELQDKETSTTTIPATADSRHETSDNDAKDSKKKLKRAIENAHKAINELEIEYPGLQVHSLEKKFEIPIKHMTECIKNENDITFVGYIDAIFKHDNGYLIIDYKTDRNTGRNSDHRKQLAAYKKMLSSAENISEDIIDTRIMYVSLTGAINTDKVEYEISKKSKRDAYPRFEADLQKILQWKQDTNIFIKELLEENKDLGVLDKTIKDKLAAATENK